MKCLLASSVFPPQVGGSGRWFWEIYRRLPRTDVFVAAGEHAAQEQFDRTHDLNVVRVPLAMPTWGTFSWSGSRGYFRNYRRVAQLVKQHRIEQIHCGCLLPEGWIAWLIQKRFGIPYVCYVHGEETNIGRSSRELGWMMRKVLGAASIVIANSRNTWQMLRNDWEVPEDRLRVLHPGVDVHRFVPKEQDSDLRRELGWAERTVILTVGRLQARKGQDHLILALNEVRRSVPDVLYVIVGDGERRGYLEALVSEHGLQDHVQFRGDIPDSELIRCYQQCDLFALPNREVNGDFEGFGMVLLEAQACGRPVLAGTSGGTAETMQVPETGRLVCCDRPEPIAAALVDLLSDRRGMEQMGQAARDAGWFSSSIGRCSQSRLRNCFDRSRNQRGINSSMPI